LLDLNRPADAIVCINKFLAAALPHNFNAHLLKGKAHLQLGEFAEGWSLYEARAHGVLGASPKRDSLRLLPAPWLGAEDVADKTVWVRCEAGFGDTIQFCRFAFLLKDRGARVILRVQNSLVRLLSRLDPEIEVIGEGDGEDLIYRPGEWDYQIPLESLPLAFRTRLGTIPAAESYIAPDPADVRRWAVRLGAATRPRIGIVWSGNPGHPNDCNRSVGLDRLRGLFGFDADWICPQKDLRPEDMETLGLSGRTSYFGQVRFFGDAIQDFADTAALVANLDLVISVDTSIAHLAGAMGKPLWIMLPFVAEWRWLMHREDCPWYPTARLFRQPVEGDWDSVVERIVAELQAPSQADHWRVSTEIRGGVRGHVMG
jgi:hypothetical protein